MMTNKTSDVTLQPDWYMEESYPNDFFYTVKLGLHPTKHQMLPELHGEPIIRRNRTPYDFRRLERRIEKIERQLKLKKETK